MIHNEKGFVLPFTLIISTIVIFFFLNQVNVYIIEKRYYHEVEGMMTVEYYMEMAVFRVKKDIQDGITGDREFVIKYPDGKAEVKITSMEEDKDAEESPVPHVFQVDIHCENKSKQRYLATFIYDSDLESITKWVE